MATEEDLDKKAKDADAEEADEAEAPAEPPPEDAAEGKAEIREKLDSEADRTADTEPVAEAAPMQLGYMRFVYAAYMGGAMVVAFLVAKIGHAAWYKLDQWKPEFGEPQDELVIYPIAGVLGILVAVYYWRKASARQYAQEVAEELSKVTWPSRKEVTNSTAVVVATTVVMTAFFALMDQFWRYITDKIYSW
jgi:preprotein translocase subunit SecE